MKDIIKNHMKEDNKGFVHYYDNNGNELHDGDIVRINKGKPQKLYLTDDGQLGTDATNPKWIESGRAYPCEYGIYSLTREDMKDIELVTERI